jgi:multiple sugar transport system permease protein
MRLSRGWAVSNAALLIYSVPAYFLIIPIYRLMHAYGLMDSLWGVIAADVTFAVPYALLILQWYGRLIPMELDEAARIDGATPLQLFRLVYLPLMLPSLVAIFTYALLLTWNEYLYAFLLLSHENTIPLAVGLGHFLSSDDSPWEILMATALIYGLPPAAIYYAFRRYMVGGLTAGAVKS